MLHPPAGRGHQPRAGRPRPAAARRRCTGARPRRPRRGRPRRARRRARSPPCRPARIDAPLGCRCCPVLAEGWSGRPGGLGSLAADGPRRPRIRRLARRPRRPSGAVDVELRRSATGCGVITEIELTAAGRAAGAAPGRRTTAPSDFELGSLDVAAARARPRAAELLDFSGAVGARAAPAARRRCATASGAGRRGTAARATTTRS